MLRWDLGIDFLPELRLDLRVLVEVVEEHGGEETARVVTRCHECAELLDHLILIQRGEGLIPPGLHDPQGLEDIRVSVHAPIPSFCQQLSSALYDCLHL